MERFGPLGGLAGEWEGSAGRDVSFHHSVGEIRTTEYRERTTFHPFGPVDNGTQSLYGLDYRTATWRADEVDPFHTEVGYWLWDAATEQVMRCFLVPRGQMVLAGGTAAADATSFTMTAELGSTTYGILSNQYLDTNARCVRYECTVELDGDEFSYSEHTLLEMSNLDDVLDHTDENRLRRVGTLDFDR